MASSALLTRVLAPQQIKEDPESLQIWGKDWTNGFVVAPSAVVFPESLDQLQDLVAYADPISASLYLQEGARDCRVVLLQPR